MKTIILNQKEKDKLIQMANFYFKPFSFHFWETDEDNYYTDGMFGYNRTMGSDSLEIHWVEFIMFHLMPKITIHSFNYSLPFNIIHYVGYQPRIKPNIISILYKQFKIINKV